ncbi:hypothetical protein ACFYZE_16285 [Streptomyces sp. NPDC001796]|uniref:hypothetical protein n=1 Tax=Streptomyces sp. NPDC001796 TaxID=3364609 RepID=UPI0036B13115
MSARDDLDYSLVTLVNLLNASKEDIGGPWLVLTTGGLVISGQLIPNWLWFETYEKELETPSDENPWAYFFSSFKDTLKEEKEEQDKAEAAAESLAPRFQQAILEATTTGFIHLRKAKVFHPGQSPLPANGMLWRGRLIDIAGWSFGRLGGDAEGSAN